MAEETALQRIAHAQRASMTLVADAFSTLVRSASAGLVRPDEMVAQMTSLLSAVGDTAGLAARPLSEFINRQRQLADAMATLADMHSQLAEVVAVVAKHHRDAVEALDALSSPLLSFANQTSGKKAARSTAKKAASPSTTKAGTKKAPSRASASVKR